MAAPTSTLGTRDCVAPEAKRVASWVVPSDLSARAAAARDSQPYWALLQAAARARYLRRAAVALLDEVEELAELLARDAGLPRTEALLAELLPTVSGLHALADHGPSALAAERLGRVPALRAGRRTILLRSPRGLVGVRAAEDAPFAEPALEVAAAVLAGNGVLLASNYGAAAARLVGALERAGLPEGLVQALPADADLAQACDEVVGGPATGPKATMLVLAGAELAAVVPGALWAAFAAAGRHPAAVGRIVTVPSVAPALLTALQAAAGRLRVGDPLRPETEVGPLRSEPQARQVIEAVDAAVAGGGTLLCGGRVTVPGHPGPFVAPVVLGDMPADAPVLRERVPGPVLSVVEARGEDEAIGLVAGHEPAVSVWTGDRRRGERLARVLGADVTWVNDHGFASAAAAVRVARHVAPHQLASQPTRLRSARWLPYDPMLVRASTASARLLHGRESERLRTLRRAAWPLARTAVRLAREALR